MNYKRNQSNPLSNIEWETCWMAVRYAMNKRTINTSSLPIELLRNYYDRWSNPQRRLIVEDLKRNFDDYKKFGDENVDNPVWMKFWYTLDKTKHYSLALSDGSEIVGFEWNDNYYPLDWFNEDVEAYIPKECVVRKLLLYKNHEKK